MQEELSKHHELVSIMSSLSLVLPFVSATECGVLRDTLLPVLARALSERDTAAKRLALMEAATSAMGSVDETPHRVLTTRGMIGSEISFS